MKILLTAALVALTTTTAIARENVHVAGSSTVLPYATIVAEAFGENFDFPTPIVEGVALAQVVKNYVKVLVKTLLI
jgi:phosphate transport system substrate-binding protein